MFVSSPLRQLPLPGSVHRPDREPAADPARCCPRRARQGSTRRSPVVAGRGDPDLDTASVEGRARHRAGQPRRRHRRDQRLPRGQTIRHLPSERRTRWALRTLPYNVGTATVLVSGISMIAAVGGGLYWLIATVLIYFLWSAGNALGSSWSKPAEYLASRLKAALDTRMSTKRDAPSWCLAAVCGSWRCRCTFPPRAAHLRGCCGRGS